VVWYTIHMDRFDLLTERPAHPPEEVILAWQKRMDESRNAGKMLDEVPRVPVSGMPGYELTPMGIQYGQRQEGNPV